MTWKQSLRLLMMASLKGDKKKGPSTATTAHRRLGDQLRDNGDWAGAVAAYERHLEISPDDQPIWEQLGHARKENGEILESEAAYLKSLSINSERSETLFHIGHLMKRSGRIPEAIDAFLAGAQNEDGVEGLAEIARLRGGQMSDSQSQRLASILATRLAKRSSGITILQVHLPAGSFGCSPVRHGQVWVDFVPGEESPLPLGRLTLKAHIQPASAAAGTLLADYGDGLVAVTNGEMGWDHDHAIRVAIYRTGLKRLRWGVSLEDSLRESFSAHFDSTEASKLSIFDRLAFQTAFEQSESAHRKSAPKAPQLAIRTMRLAQPLAVAGRADFLVREYQQWIRLWEAPRSPRSLKRFRGDAPIISFVIPIYRPSIAPLRSCIEAILAQTLDRIELCAVVDGDISKEADELLRAYAQSDARVRLVYRQIRGHISAATNSGIEASRGDYLVFVDQDDLVHPDCAFEVADVTSEFPNVKIVYSDEDKITPQGIRTSPHMKGEFDPLLLLGNNSVGHAFAIERQLCLSLGGLRLGYEGAQDHDLALRAFEAAGAAAIKHVPKVLYHWRESPGSTASSVDAKPYAERAMLTSVNAHLVRLGLGLVALPGVAAGRTFLKHQVENIAKVTAIVINLGDGNLLSCLRSIIKCSRKSLEIFIITTQALSDDEVDFIETTKLDIEVHITDSQSTYKVASGFGLTAANEMLLICNSSTSFINTSCLDRAHALLSIPNLGVLGCQIVMDSGVIAHFGLAFGEGEANNLYEGSPSGTGCNFDKNRLLQLFSAVELTYFVRRSLFRQAKGFDGAMSGRDADIDFCIRARQLGFNVAADPDIRARREPLTKGSLQQGRNGSGELAIRWAENLKRDCFYSPNLDLRRVGRLAHPPRR